MNNSCVISDDKVKFFKLKSARKLTLGRNDDPLKILKKIIGRYDVTGQIQKKMVDYGLSEDLPEKQDNHIECWLTLSEEVDGITYLDLYKTE